MQIVIDITDDEYKGIVQNNPKNFIPIDYCEVIRKGTPLPKGRGKLVVYGYVVDAIDDWINAEEYRYTNATYYLRKRVANVPTIIEADKE